MRRPSSRSRRVVVGLAVATMLAAPACGSGGGAKPKGNATVSIKNFEFAPERIALPVDSELRVVNEDSTPHTLTAQDKSFDTGNIAADKEGVVKLSTAGVFEYHCTIHPTMTGVIQVRA